MNKDSYGEGDPTVTTLLMDQIDELRSQVNRHITECTAQSRKLFWALIATLGWLVTHTEPFTRLVPHL